MIKMWALRNVGAALNTVAAQAAEQTPNLEAVNVCVLKAQIGGRDGGQHISLETTAYIPSGADIDICVSVVDGELPDAKAMERVANKDKSTTHHDTQALTHTHTHTHTPARTHTHTERERESD